MSPALVEGIDYTMEGDKLVFTAEYHRKRGYCCNSRCRHCPYREDAERLTAEALATLSGLPPAGERR